MQSIFVCVVYASFQTLKDGFLTDLIVTASYQCVGASKDKEDKAQSSRNSGGLVTNRKRALHLQHHTLASTGAVATGGGEQDTFRMDIDLEPEQEGALVKDKEQNSKMDLESARLNCNFKTLDLVTSLDIRALVEREEEEGGGFEQVQELQSGTPFSLQVVLTSKDSNFMSEPRLEDINVAVRYSEGGSRANTAFALSEDMESALASGTISRPPGQVSALPSILYSSVFLTSSRENMD